MTTCGYGRALERAEVRQSARSEPRASDPSGRARPKDRGVRGELRQGLTQFVVAIPKLTARFADKSTRRRHLRGALPGLFNEALDPWSPLVAYVPSG